MVVLVITCLGILCRVVLWFPMNATVIHLWDHCDEMISRPGTSRFLIHAGSKKSHLWFMGFDRCLRMWCSVLKDFGLFHLWHPFQHQPAVSVDLSFLCMIVLVIICLTEEREILNRRREKALSCTISRLTEIYPSVLNCSQSVEPLQIVSVTFS